MFSGEFSAVDREYYQLSVTDEHPEEAVECPHVMEGIHYLGSCLWLPCLLRLMRLCYWG